MTLNPKLIGELADSAMKIGHSKYLPLSKRIQIIKYTLYSILKVVCDSTELKTKAQEYIDNRDKTETPKLLKIQEEAQKELNDYIQQKYPNLDFWIKPQSSLSARTHLIGSSDIDFSIGVDNVQDLAIDYATLKHNNPDLRSYEYKKDGVDIEFKIRNKNTYKSYIHDFMDYEMSKVTRNAITYIKYILSNYREYKMAYGAFKALVYEWASIRGQENRGITNIEFLYELE